VVKNEDQFDTDRSHMIQLIHMYSIQRIPVKISAIQRYKAVRERVDSAPNQRPVQLTHHHHQANVTIDLGIQIVARHPPISSSCLWIL
jgi:hypothetical protein